MAGEMMCGMAMVAHLLLSPLFASFCLHTQESQNHFAHCGKSARAGQKDTSNQRKSVSTFVLLVNKRSKKQKE